MRFEGSFETFLLTTVPSRVNRESSCQFNEYFGLKIDEAMRPEIHPLRVFFSFTYYVI